MGMFGAFKNALGFGGGKSSSQGQGFGGIAEEILRRNPNAGTATAPAWATKLGAAGQPMGGAADASNPNWVPETIMSDAAGNTAYNPSTGISSKLGAANSGMSKGGYGQGTNSGVSAPGQSSTGQSLQDVLGGTSGPGVAGKAPLDMGMAGLASQGLLRGSDPGVVQENIRQLKNQGFSDEEAINQAIQFSQQ